jgi:hypothetical protein
MDEIRWTLAYSFKRQCHSLADLVKQRGVRPLNISISGAIVKLVLSDPSGVWAKSAPGLEVSLGL